MISGEGKLFTTVRCKNNEEWLEERKKGLGGSDMAALLGISPWSSPTELWLEKTNQPLPDETTGSNPVEFGNIMEEFILRKFAEEHPNFIVRRVNAMLRSIEHPWAQASLDGEVREENGSWGIVEVKCPGSVAMWNDGVPAHYVAQAQHYMYVTGRTFCWFCAFFRDTCEFKWIRIERDDALIAEMEQEASDFWHNHVETNIPPTKISGQDREATAIAKAFPKRSSNILNAIDDMDISALIDEWLAAKDAENTAKEEKTRIQNQLMQIIGNNSGVLVEAGRLTWVRTTTKKLDKVKLNLLYPGSIDACSEEVPRNMGLRWKPRKV